MGASSGAREAVDHSLASSFLVDKDECLHLTINSFYLTCGLLQCHCDPMVDWQSFPSQPCHWTYYASHSPALVQPSTARLSSFPSLFLPFCVAKSLWELSTSQLQTPASTWPDVATHGPTTTGMLGSRTRHPTHHLPMRLLALYHASKGCAEPVTRTSLVPPVLPIAQL